MPLAVFTSPGPLLFQLGPFSLRWYGLLIALAVLLGLVLATRLGKLRGIDPALIADLLPILVLAAVVGARLYYVVFEWRQYQLNWLDALAVWRGGIAIHGALLGGTAAVIGRTGMGSPSASGAFKGSFAAPRARRVPGSRQLTAHEPARLQGDIVC